MGIEAVRPPEDWWKIVLGSGRGQAIEQLAAAELATVKETNPTLGRDRRITRLKTNALYAITTKKSN